MESSRQSRARERERYGSTLVHVVHEIALGRGWDFFLLLLLLLLANEMQLMRIHTRQL